jgi:Protein of unknown function (DUF1573)
MIERQGALRVVPTMAAVGRIWRRNWAENVKLTNDGTEPIRIVTVRPSCDCVSARLDKRVIEPGESLPIMLKGEIRGPGRFAYELWLNTSSRDMPKLTIPIHGIAIPPLLPREPGLQFERIYAGDSAEKSVMVDLLEGADPKQIHFNIPKDAPLQMKVSQSAPNTCKVSVAWLGTQRPGWHRFEVPISVSNIADVIAISIFVSANVVPRCVAYPESVFLRGEELGHRWMRSIHVEGPDVDSATLAVSWEDPAFERLAEIRNSPDTVRPGAGDFVLEGKPSVPGDLSGRMATLTVRSHGRPIARIPVTVHTRLTSTGK